MKSRMLNANDKLWTQNNEFHELNRVAHETENMASGISTTLRGQRDVIIKGLNTVTKFEVSSLSSYV